MIKRFLPHLPYLFAIWLVAGAVYFKTLPPSILYIDAGTMVAAAYEPGIPNPPGFPSYVLLAHLFTKLPFGDILFRVQLVSLISALGVLSLVYFLVRKLVAESHPGGVCGLAATLILAFSYQFWSQTLNTESYIFTNFLMMSLLTLALTIPSGAKKIGKRLILGGVILGLGSGANPTIVQVLPALGLAAFFNFRRLDIKSLILAIVTVAVLTVLVYSYLPIRASQYPFLNWGNPQTVELFWGHLKGEGLDINDPRTNSVNGFTGSPQIFARSAGRYLYLGVIQFTPLFIPFIIAGMFSLYQKNRRLFLSLTTIPLTNLIFGGLYLSGNQESWFIASYVIFAVFIGIGINFGIKIFLSYLSHLRYLSYLIILVLVFLPLLWWFPKLDRSNHIITTEYVNNLYSNLPKNTVLIGSGDFFNSASLYQYLVLKERPDVFPIVANMWYVLPWYRDNLRHQRPDLMPEELEKMIKKDRLEEYNEVMNWYIKWLMDKGFPVYVTPTVFNETVLAGTDAGKFVPDKNILKAINQGLSYRMLEARDLMQMSEDSLNFKFKDPEFFKKPPFYLERNYKAGYHLLLQDYGLGYLSLAEQTGQNTLFYLKKAYEIAPFSPEIVNRAAVIMAMQGNMKEAIKYFKEATGLVPANFDIRLNLAKALIADKQEQAAQKELQYIISSADNDSIKAEAQAELSKLAVQNLVSTIPGDWQEIKVKGQGFSLQYPSGWTATTQNSMTVLRSDEGEFTVSIYGGLLSAGVSREDWVKKSPVKFSGRQEDKGPAQIPPFEAEAVFWQEPDNKKYLEFLLVKERNILHLKVGPIDSKSMQKFDQILSGIKLSG